jgi:HTH-type transcriptional regulator/antitoxin HigA
MEQTDNTVGLSCDLIIHPGETLAEALEERNMTQSELAERTGMSELYIEQVIKGQQDITSEFALKLEGAFGIESLFWMNLQKNYDREIAAYMEFHGLKHQ